jgi:hypothetical protein
MICIVQSGIEREFSPSTSVSPGRSILPALHSTFIFSCRPLLPGKVGDGRELSEKVALFRKTLRNGYRKHFHFFSLQTVRDAASAAQFT